MSISKRELEVWSFQIISNCSVTQSAFNVMYEELQVVTALTYVL